MEAACLPHFKEQNSGLMTLLSSRALSSSTLALKSGDRSILWHYWSQKLVPRRDWSEWGELVWVLALAQQCSAHMVSRSSWSSGFLSREVEVSNSSVPVFPYRSIKHKSREMSTLTPPSHSCWLRDHQVCLHTFLYPQVLSSGLCKSKYCFHKGGRGFSPTGVLMELSICKYSSNVLGISKLVRHCGLMNEEDSIGIEALKNGSHFNLGITYIGLSQ